MANSQHSTATPEIQGTSHTPNREIDLIHTAHGRPITTSLIVAERFKKRHKNVLKAIRNLECSDGFRRLNFEPTFYEVPGPKNSVRQEEMFTMTKDGFAILVMGFTGKEAMAWKERFLEAFNAMNTALMEREPWRYSPLPGRTKRSPQRVSFCDILNALPTLGGEIYREDLYYSLRLLIEQIRRGQYREKARIERRLRTLERLANGGSHE